MATQSAQTRRELAARAEERAEAAARERGECHRGLSESTAKLRTHLEFIGRKRWPDMDERLARLEELAAEVAVGAGSIARLGEDEVTRAAREVSAVATALAAEVAAAVGPAGEYRDRIDFQKFDATFDAFLALTGPGGAPRDPAAVEPASPARGRAVGDSR
ncbi:hypothetical protein [Actinomadura sp. 7K534]|uniref:hypothetical protein n=1 Tax=Actinomadura sp. 7K534 TaxID=2530366 RepID=UPI001049732A|nr:hypothetical protein [Actinomadura sp. 7K534]TDB91991.1 hypothetical protein E1266_25885 [Actinomadura sp. 7K534]